jgi:hypothetical protein
VHAKQEAAARKKREKQATAQGEKDLEETDSDTEEEDARGRLILLVWSSKLKFVKTCS